MTLTDNKTSVSLINYWVLNSITFTGHNMYVNAKSKLKLQSRTAQSRVHTLGLVECCHSNNLYKS